MSNRELLEAIQDELADGNVDLATALRRLLIVVSRIGNDSIKTWAEMELDGYPELSAVPDYRVLHGLQSLGIFFGIGGYQLRNQLLSLSGLPEQVRRGYSDPEVRQGVTSIAEMVRSQQEGTVSGSWPADACQHYDHSGWQEDLLLMQAWIAVPAAALVGLLDAVRSKALGFALEIEKQLDPETELEPTSDQSDYDRQIGFH